MASSKANRTRAPLTVAIDALQPYAVKPNFITYPKNRTDAIRPDLIVAHREMLRSIRRVAPNMSFSQSTLVSALADIHEKRFAAQHPGWNVAPNEVETWSQHVALQLRAMFRHVSQAVVKKSTATWLRLLDFDSLDVESDNIDEDEMVDDEVKDAPTGSASAKKARPSYWYGYDREYGMPWRSPIGNPAAKEWADEVCMPEGAKPTSPTRASWADGDVRDIPEHTCEEFKKGMLEKPPTHAAPRTTKKVRFRAIRRRSGRHASQSGVAKRPRVVGPQGRT